MARELAASITILLYSACTIFAQGKFDPVIHDLGPMCEGKVFEIGMLDEFSCFHITYGSRNCASTTPYTAVDKSENINVAGATPISSRVWKQYTTDGTNYIKVLLYTFKAEKTTEITITCKSPIDVVIPEGCVTPEVSYIQERTYIYKLQVISKPSTPSLTVERYISPGTVNFIASGCPTDKEGYDYQWNSTFCAERVNDNFGKGNRDGTLSAVSGASYRVLCSALNGTCLSEPSKFETGISYRPPDLSQVPKEYVFQIQRIEAIKKYDLNLSYHHYSVETAICDKDINPSCSIENVFNILLSGNQFIAAITNDMIGVGNNNRRFSYDNFSPVQSYGVVNLSGPAIRYFIEKDLGFITKLFPNPIMTYIDYPNNSIINYTLPGHILSPGRVIRQVVQRCNKVYVDTIGEGNSDLLFPFDIAAAQINISEGKRLFENVDARVRNEYQRRFP